MCEDDIQPSKNSFSSLVQLRSLEKGLSRDTALKANYVKTIKEDLEKCYIITVLDAHMLEQRSDKERYLPHHPARVLNGA